jgi:histidyl-tRNA synthetase
LLIALESQGVALPEEQKPLVWIVTQGDGARDAGWQLMRELRQAGIACDADLSGRSMKAQFKLADREKAAWCVVIGESELAAGTVNLKDLAKHEQVTVARAEVVGRLKAV